MEPFLLALIAGQTAAIVVLARGAATERARFLDAIVARTPAEFASLRAAEARPAKTPRLDESSDVHFPIGL